MWNKRYRRRVLQEAIVHVKTTPIVAIEDAQRLWAIEAFQGVLETNFAVMMIVWECQMYCVRLDIK